MIEVVRNTRAERNATLCIAVKTDAHLSGTRRAHRAEHPVPYAELFVIAPEHQATARSKTEISLI
ncbi:MAG: hypothetical protein AAF829_13165 [Pseudomonadota bacterium]